MSMLLETTTSFLPYSMFCTIIPSICLFAVIICIFADLIQKGNPNKLKKVLFGLVIVAVLILLIVSTVQYQKSLSQAGVSIDIPNYFGLLYIGVDIIITVVYFIGRKIFDIINRE